MTEATTPSWPFGDKPVSRNGLVKWIAQTLYPDDLEKVAMQRVRSHLQDAKKRTDPKRHRHFGPMIDPYDFFSWVSYETGEWRKLCNVGGVAKFLPVIGGGLKQSIGNIEVNASGVTMDGDIERLQIRYLECQTENRRLRTELIQKQRELEQLKKRKSDGSAAGKQGGRGHEK